jgi:hypothetical protein
MGVEPSTFADKPTYVVRRLFHQAVFQIFSELHLVHTVMSQYSPRATMYKSGAMEELSV